MNRLLIVISTVVFMAALLNGGTALFMDGDGDFIKLFEPIVDQQAAASMLKIVFLNSGTGKQPLGQLRLLCLQRMLIKMKPVLSCEILKAIESSWRVQSNLSRNGIIMQAWLTMKK